MIILLLIFAMNNLYSILLSPIQSTMNLFLMGCLVVVLFNYRKQECYDYDAENPNALQTGRGVAGTVYASYPNMSGGLGWII